MSDLEIEDLKVVLFIERDVPDNVAFLENLEIDKTNALLIDLETKEEIKLVRIQHIHMHYNKIELELKDIIIE